MHRVLYFTVLLVFTVSCKDQYSSINENTEALSTETPENQDIELPTEDEPTMIQEAVLHRILEHNDLGNLQMGSTTAVVAQTALRPGDSLNPVKLQHKGKEVDGYRFTKNGVAFLDFYLKNKRIYKVDVLAPAAVPEGMVAPGSRLKDLRKIDPSIKPYGSAFESQVTVTMKDVIYLLDARHPIEEPLDLYPSTPILKISFTR